MEDPEASVQPWTQASPQQQDSLDLHQQPVQQVSQLAWQEKVCYCSSKDLVHKEDLVLNCVSPE